ncbi:MAG: DUF3604 domain-containing protein, partial [Rhodothermales bacterium]|nr:DUF3604 domain-containing protein [Rhodothermales bacterium]
PMNSPEVRESVWDEVTKIADQHNTPGEFTAFIGWEWTSLPESRNLHRIVFMDKDSETATKFLPYSSLDSTRPRDLYNWMAKTSKAVGTDFVAISHNMNLSGGTMFPLIDEYGNPVNAEYGQLRGRWEPVVEMTQYKGDSEAHPELSPNDPFADFETYEHALGAGGEAPDPEAGDYIRTALMRGLQMENLTGVNPYQFGLSGATDSHTGFSAAEEDNFLGKYALDSIPANGSKETVPGAIGWDAAAAGLTAVWATENTRRSIMDAFQRREVYATTGPRITLRFFGGFDIRRRHARAADIAAVGYENGVPMGAMLAGSKDGDAPSFLIHAAKDPVGANLDRVQVVRGTLNADGSVSEQVFDVALADGRTDGSVLVGNTVNIETGKYTNDIGDPELVTVWSDPDFDPSLSAFYYVRVLQIPTPRHSLLDAIALQIDPSEVGHHPATIQERAYSSPIWYTPHESQRAAVTPLKIVTTKVLTVDEVLAQGFRKMTSTDLGTLIGKPIVLANVVSNEEYRGVFTKEGGRSLEKVDMDPEQTTQALYHGGHMHIEDLLLGATGYEIVDDTVVSSDGLRTVVSTLYTDGETIYAARDIDKGKVMFEVRSE